MVFWFENNDVKLNTDKCRLLISESVYVKMRVEIGKDKNWEISDVKLLRVTFDNKLNFDSQSYR